MQTRQASLRATSLFLASLVFSIGLFLAWAYTAPLPPALAWPLALVAMALPVAVFFRTKAKAHLPARDRHFIGACS